MKRAMFFGLCVLLLVTLLPDRANCQSSVSRSWDTSQYASVDWDDGTFSGNLAVFRTGCCGTMMYYRIYDKPADVVVEEGSGEIPSADLTGDGHGGQMTLRTNTSAGSNPGFVRSVGAGGAILVEWKAIPDWTDVTVGTWLRRTPLTILHMNGTSNQNQALAQGSVMSYDLAGVWSAGIGSGQNLTILIERNSSAAVESALTGSSEGSAATGKPIQNLLVFLNTGANAYWMSGNLLVFVGVNPQGTNQAPQTVLSYAVYDVSNYMTVVAEGYGVIPNSDLEFQPGGPNGVVWLHTDTSGASNPSFSRTVGPGGVLDLRWVKTPLSVTISHTGYRTRTGPEGLVFNSSGHFKEFSADVTGTMLGLSTTSDGGAVIFTGEQRVVTLTF
jgi:hypothetical protein